MQFTLNIDPAELSSAQLKVINFKTKRIITNPRVARGMKLVRNAVFPYAKRCAAIQASAPKGAVAVGVCFWFAYPASGTKKEKAARYAGEPVVSARWGDCDNRAKAFIDTLVQAGCFTDDRYISSLLIRKRYTFQNPRVEVLVVADKGDPFDPEKETIWAA